MYELKKDGKVFTSKFVGTGPSSYEKKNLPGRGLTKVEKHWHREHPSNHHAKLTPYRPDCIRGKHITYLQFSF